jgi:hypothetical protein
MLPAMKWLSLLPLFCLGSCTAQQQPPAGATKTYVDEAPLPKGWPQPGPYDQVVEKTYPAYRAAFATKGLQTFAFWKLFNHIKAADIPMTAPVEMAMNEGENGLMKAEMAFLYQDQTVGKPGTAGTEIEVRDVPSAKVLSYTWQGKDSKANIATAREALQASLAQRKLTSTGFRLLGYNGPGTPEDKKTWELQALLK